MITAHFVTRYSMTSTPLQPASDQPISGDAASFETIYVTTKRVACDGGGGALGHPRVWLHLGEDDAVMCTYCSRNYVMANDAEGA